MNIDRPLRICIDARIPDGPASGGRAVLVGLATAFSRLADGDEEYYFLALEESHAWLEPLLGGNCRLLPVRNDRSAFRRFSRRLPGTERLRASIRLHLLARKLELPYSDGTIEAAQMDIMYFVRTVGFRTKVNSIYEIHDLQHLHYPEYFSANALKERDFRYRALCKQARIVTVPSQWGKNDLADKFGIAKDKIAVVPWAPVLEDSSVPSEDSIAMLRRKYGLPESFALYPAHTWPHKNHLRLLDALAIVRERYGEQIPLVCSGGQGHFLRTIKKCVLELNLKSQVTFVGFVSPLELNCLYRMSRLVVFPTMFEGWGLPLLEACLSETAVACSNIGPFQEQASGAALMFDPRSSSELAEAMHTLWTDENRRAQLIESGRERVKQFTWERTARILRAHFRAVAGRRIISDDEALLSELSRT